MKLLGIAVALPNTIRNILNWRSKEIAKLWEENSVYNRNGRQVALPRWKRVVYRITRMPCRHLWDKKYSGHVNASRAR